MIVKFVSYDKNAKVGGTEKDSARSIIELLWMVGGSTCALFVLPQKMKTCVPGNG